VPPDNSVPARGTGNIARAVALLHRTVGARHAAEAEGCVAEAEEGDKPDPTDPSDSPLMT